MRHQLGSDVTTTQNNPTDSVCLEQSCVSFIVYFLFSQISKTRWIPSVGYWIFHNVQLKYRKPKWKHVIVQTANLFLYKSTWVIQIVWSDIIIMLSFWWMQNINIWRGNIRCFNLSNVVLKINTTVSIYRQECPYKYLTIPSEYDQSLRFILVDGLHFRYSAALYRAQVKQNPWHFLSSWIIMKHRWNI